MNQKVIFRSVFVLAVALGLFGVRAPSKDAPDVRTNAVRKEPFPSRALASYRVIEQKIDRGMDFRGANYNAVVQETGSRFGRVPETGSRTAGREFTVEFGTPRIEQGSVQLECGAARFERPAHGVAQIHRGAVTEEYVCENRRIEQVFRFPVALSTGALRVAIPVTTDLSGPVVVHPPDDPGCKDFRLAKGGLAFTDGQGETKAVYHSAFVLDAEGHQLALLPRYEHAEIVLEVPASFMATAAYPVVIDPWFDMGVGISSGFHSAEKPAFLKFGTGGDFAGVVAWSDSSNGNFEIYVMGFNGNSFIPFGTSGNPGGISQNAGRSVNPAIASDTKGQPVVAWEDDTSGTISIFAKRFNATAGTWDEMAGSATQFGLSGNLGVNRHPSIASMAGVIPGAITVDGSGNVTSSQPPTNISVPVVAWSSGGTTLFCSAFYPGAPAIPPNNLLPKGAPAVPAGWYQLGTPDGAAVDSTNFDPSASVFDGDFPSIVVDTSNRPAIAYETTVPGNFEIFLSRWSYNAVPPSTKFQIASNATNTGFDILPAANWNNESGAAAPGGTGTPGNVSSTPSPSQFPSLAVDGVNLIVAWQETESAVIPTPPGTSSQIYVKQSTAGGAFAAIGLNSASIGGISKTLALASTPSVDVAGGYIGVAWADTSNSRSSIYVRRLPQSTPAVQWQQVGFQGSAFPPAFVGEVAPIGGVSQSPNFAIQPQISLDPDGNPSVVWADGDLANFNILGKMFVGNAPGVAVGIGTVNPTFNVQVQQSSTDPSTLITPVNPGGVVNGTSIWLFARVFTEDVLPATSSLRLEIEIQPKGSAFTNTPNVPQTLFVLPDSPPTAPPPLGNPNLGNLCKFLFDGLPNFSYHWQARTVDQIGRSSPWVSPGEVNGVSFSINNVAGGPGSGPALSLSTPSRGHCGLTGLEALGALVLAWGLRRRKK